MSGAKNRTTAVVVPTLGTRPDFLGECLRSIRKAGDCHVAVVRPLHSALDESLADLIDAYIDDPGSGLAAALNAGLASLPSSILYATWLGDDDRLTAGSLSVTSAAMKSSGAVLVYGGCRYIDASGRQLWLNKSGGWAAPLMRCGPQLVPQPGSLFDRRIFDTIGGLDELYKWAFDLDLFLRLGRHGKVKFINATLAEFRWHEGSLSVGGRKGSVTEASAIRRAALPVMIRPFSVLWEPLLRRIILFAGERMSRRLTTAKQSAN